MPFFDRVPLLPQDPIFKLPIAFAADPRSHKVNLGVGVYKDALGNSLLLTSVRDAEKILLQKEKNKDYLPIDGLPAFNQGISSLVFGKELPPALFTVQCPGGTSALRTGADFLVREISRVIYIPEKTWPNHQLVFTRSGMDVRTYRYYDEEKKELNFEGLVKDINQMPAGSAILLHASCHNPTGLDPTQEQWQELSSLIRKARLIPFFDCAYQGFAKDLDADVESIRRFVADGHEMLVAYSCSKNFGLYCERVGALSIVASNQENLEKVNSQIKKIIRSNYSNPPRHGASIVAEILQSESLKKDWVEELSNMRTRLQQMRETLVAILQKDEHVEYDWSFIQKENGFFSYLGLNPEQVETLTNKHAIHLPSDGRINIAGLNSNNIEYVAKALIEVSKLHHQVL